MNLDQQIVEFAPASAYDATVFADIDAFERQAQAHLRGELTADEFRPFRLRRGIYTQRQTGVHMIRTKVPGGLLTAGQMRQLARVADEFAGGKAHLTTRQNVQYHFVPLARVAPALRVLAEGRLTTREACYNTVRNVTACPYAGLAADEIFDVLPYARRVAYAFLHQELTDNLPRKFKIGFSGRPVDTIATDINDLGFRAVVRVENGVERRGFRVTVGGGLGPLPNEAKVLDEFLPVEHVVQRTESVVRLFNRFGNRGNKNKARLKFVLRERGFDWLKETADAEFTDILTHGGVPVPDEVPEGFGGFLHTAPPPATGAQLPIVDLSQPLPGYEEWRRTNVEPQRQAGYSIVTLAVPQGNLTSGEMRAMADVAEQAGDGFLRLTMTQNVMLAFVPTAQLKRVYATLAARGLAAAGAREITDVMSCPGAYSCNLALTKSMNLGDALAQALAGQTDPRVRKLQIHVSGCPNSCGQHWTGDFGFYGNARKIDGVEVPYYLMLLGGGPDGAGVTRFGLAIQSLPARLIPEAVRRVIDHYLLHGQEGETFRQYVMRHKVETFRQLTADLAKPAELFPEIYQDWGDDVAYSLSLGKGECAA